MYQKRSHMYDTETFQQSSRVDTEVLGSMKEKIFVFHDESTIHAKERPKSSWLLPGTTEIQSKNTETFGRLELSNIEFQSSQHDGGTKPVSANAATVIYPGSNGDPWWDMEQLFKQVSKKAIPIFQHLHPNSQAVFIFDCSSEHGAFSKTVLRVQNMNLKPGGKQSHLRDSIIPYPKLAGQAKGVQTILEERGLWQHYRSKARENGKPALKLRCDSCAMSNMRKDATKQSAKLLRQAKDTGYFLSQEQCVNEIMATNSSSPDVVVNQDESNNSSTCCWSKIMSCQSDFVNERPLLQQIIEDSGHVCLFLPKFDCELNPIELFWSYIKDSYQQGYNGPQSQVLIKKYKSHRCIPRNAVMSIDMLT
ncbi:uncharacterized protein PGTG_05219 [Puccinia graminis f. sp. tritici CRL 75-36-700-3]|uniref:Tc1-like transposase DDE domain-containing protein n=1 Tax=Puccinia graminis f. sp. tritici (strain CRL 75-36-700-3 / race SCCL) TaxID=418459 RepID=E3K784_PUCGT|nr:uncharacterized protein PGTG_05219 [Puccinia graminis f. sp. tritici CRL 75-36-700-3]EFP79994.2 hypothetical protein PGTG_05219 [Puccinia graminis f. sp. tritici CRL 75-36-700-3]